MRPGDSNELLSAYLDREVTPAEREAVEARLDASPDTRAELDAIAELSLCLRTMDRPEAPADFQASVMQVLAGRRHQPATVPAEPPRRKSRREWIISMVAVATSALSLFLMLTNWNPAQTPASVGSGPVSFSAKPLDSTHPTVPASFDAPHSGLDDRVKLSAMSERGDGLSQPERRHAMFMDANGDLQPPRPAAAPVTTSGTAALASRVPETDASRSMAREASNPDVNAMKNVPLNDVLNFWAEPAISDRYVANIDVQVLDVQKTVGGFQFLLYRNAGMEKENPYNEAGEAKKAEGKEVVNNPVGRIPELEVKQQLAAEVDENSMIAVYVDSTPEVVSKSLEELADKFGVVGMPRVTPLALMRTESPSDETPSKKVAEGIDQLQQGTIEENVARAYLTQQRNWVDVNGPADAEQPLNRARGLEDATVANETQARKSMPGNAKFAANMPAPKAAEAMEKKDTLRDAPTNYNSLMVCSTVRIPVEPNAELIANNFGANAGAVPEARANRLQQDLNFNLQRAKPPQNQMLGNTANSAYRYRQSGNRDGVPSVRVLVVFQDAPAAMKEAPSIQKARTP